MSRNVVVEVSHLLRRDAGGIGRLRLTTGLPKLRDAHERIWSRPPEGGWPHLRTLGDDTLAEALRVAEGLRARARELVVVGQPGAVAAVRAVADGAGSAAVRWLTSPDDDALAAFDRDDVAWLVLEGPPWADAVAEWAVGKGRAVAVAGPGTHDAPPGGWWISDPLAGDGRFGGLGAAAAVCGAWAGADMPAFHAGARDMVEACARPALFENPAYTLALTTIFAERDLYAGVPVHLVPTARLEAFAHWLVRLWGAVVNDAVPEQGAVRHAGAAGVAGVVGDEELLQTLLLGPRDKLVVVWDPVRARGPLADEAEAQVRALRDLLDRESMPHLRVRLPGRDARALGAATQLAACAAVSAAVFLDVDPLGLAGVSAWYGALERARADVDGEPATA